MADLNHTLESSSAQEKPSYTINLIVQNVCASTPPGVGSIAHSVISAQYNPYIILQGAWLRELGFEVGDRIRVEAETDCLRVTPRARCLEANTLVKIISGRSVSNVDFMEEVDGIKAEKGCMVDVTGSSKFIGKSAGQSGDRDVGRYSGKDAGESSHKDTAKSKGISDVLTGVKRELDYD